MLHWPRIDSILGGDSSSYCISSTCFSQNPSRKARIDHQGSLAQGIPVTLSWQVTKAPSELRSSCDRALPCLYSHPKLWKPPQVADLEELAQPIRSLLTFYLPSGNIKRMLTGGVLGLPGQNRGVRKIHIESVADVKGRQG